MNKPDLPFTHAGGLVFRDQGGELRYLIVQAKGNPAHWILPKGHLEPGETPEETALRELAEETGVKGRIITELGWLQFSFAGRQISTIYYLMAFQDQVPPQENRVCLWLPYEEARQLLTFPATKELLAKAHAYLKEQTPPGRP